MKKRSPITHLDTIAKANLKIFHGKRDPVVPVSHSLTLFNEILDKHPNARVYLDVFDGGHQMDMEVAEHWILSQYDGAKNVQVTG
jgi:predicted esterase